MKLNEKILYYRKAAKLSQEGLAEKVGVSRQAVSKWELGDATPELDKLAALARTFGVTTDALLSEDEPVRETEQPPLQAPPVSEDLTFVLRNYGRFRRWYLPIFIGLMLFAFGLWQCVDTWGSHYDIPFLEQTMGPMRYISIAMAVFGAGVVVWGTARLIIHRRKEKKAANIRKKS